MGYGSRALNLLSDYYQDKLTSLGESKAATVDPVVAITTDDSEERGLLKETICPRSSLPPLLTKLSDRPPEMLDYIGVSYGLTPNLYKSINNY